MEEEFKKVAFELNDEFQHSKEDEDDDDEPFDDTLEQLMTLDNSNNLGASMLTDNGVEGAAPSQPKKDEEVKASGIDNSQSLKKVIRILRFI